MGYWASLARAIAVTDVGVGPEGRPLGDQTPDDCWKLGLFYYNAQDAASLVPARCGPGYALNFARPVSWLASSAAAALLILALTL